MHAAHILPLLFACAIGGRQTLVQLSHTFHDGNLVLQCKVNDPYLSVFIVDINNKEQGHCRPIPVPKCFNYFPSETQLSFNSTTNVTTFIKGASDISKIIGNWKCKHGSGDGNPLSTIYVTMTKKNLVSGEPADNQATTATYLSYVAVVIGFVPKTKVLFCKVVRKIIECTGTSNLCNKNNFLEWILLKLVGMIPECGLQPEKKKNIIVKGIKLILCLVLFPFPYWTVRIIDHYYFRNTKDKPKRRGRLKSTKVHLRSTTITMDFPKKLLYVSCSQ